MLQRRGCHAFWPSRPEAAILANSQNVVETQRGKLALTPFRCSFDDAECWFPQRNRPDQPQVRLFDLVPAGFIAERITHIDDETCIFLS